MSAHNTQVRQQTHLIGRLADAYGAIATLSTAPFKKSIRIRILRNFSADYLVPFVDAYFRRAGIRADILMGGYDTAQQDALGGEPGGQLSDLTVLALTLDGLIPDWQSSPIDAKDIAGRVIAIAEAAARSGGTIIINSFIRPVDDSAGPAATLADDSAESLILGANLALRNYARNCAPRIVLVDWERLVMLVGAAGSFDRRTGYIAGLPFKGEFLGAYAYEIFKTGAALLGASKKCLILDCDGTLWGGVVGEQGREGIALDRHSYPGCAYYDFQRSLVRLAKRGVLIALCSKNDESDVLDVLDHHPHCVLKREDLVDWRINWEAKEVNTAAMVQNLNIGMDAVVFIDDSAVECARVKAFLPEITVRQVPEQPFRLPSLIDAEDLFHTLAVTAEDRMRTGQYRAELHRQQAAVTYESIEDFLATLDLQVRISAATPADTARIAQLTQKTNQFNLTTRRYSEADIRRMAASPDYCVLALHVRDRFGDQGLSGVFIAQRHDTAARIDTFLLSCRVLGRGLEVEFAARCIESLGRQWSVDDLMAEYVKTSKNGQAAHFWADVGLRPGPDGDHVIYRGTVNPSVLRHAAYVTVLP